MDDPVTENSQLKNKTTILIININTKQKKTKNLPHYTYIHKTHIME